MSVIVSKKSISTFELKSLPHTAINTDWYGKEVNSNALFLLAIDDEFLHFSAQIHSPNWQEQGSLQKLTPHESGYAQGLWNYDVAELFICDNGNPDMYQEFNLNPQGAWWTCLFVSPRKRAQQNQQSKLLYVRPIITTQNTKDAWHVTMSYSRASFLVETNFESDFRFNVCFIIGQIPRTYLTYAKLQGNDPDFHQPKNFVAYLDNGGF